jgi:hypothetical protein
MDGVMGSGGETVLLPGFVLVAHELKVEFQRERVLQVVGNEIGAGARAAIDWGSGNIPCRIMKSKPSVVDLTVS